MAAYLLWLAWLFIEESLVASLRNRPHPLDLLVILVVPILTLTCGFVVRSARRLPAPPSDPAAMLRRTFAAAPDGWFHCIESAFEIVDVEAGQTIWEAGDPASGIALVVSGRLRTSLRSRPSVVFAGGHDREVEPSGPGSLHGYLSAFTGHSHHLTFTALTDARLLVISKARLDALPATAMLAVARVVMARSSHEYRHHTAVVANLMQ